MECDSFDWSERFVRLEKMGEEMKEKQTFFRSSIAESLAQV